MTNSQDEISKIYVNHDGVAVIECPECEARKTVKVDKFKGSRHILKIKCSCQNLFQVNLEFRKLYRKMVRFSGHYVLLPRENHRHKIDQELQVSFTLDDKQRSLIDRRVIVRLVQDDYASCELVGGTSHDKALGFYMMA